MSEDTKDIELDMFGAPVAQVRERWGRPSFSKTKENQETVAVLKAAGWSQKRIADFIGCDEKTLRKNFSRELEKGADLIEGMALMLTWKQVKEGKSPAATRLFDIIEKSRLVPPKREPKKAPEGKKERLAREATQPPGSWMETLQ